MLWIQASHLAPTPAYLFRHEPDYVVRDPLPDNAESFRSRPPENRGRQELRPLFLEMTFIDLNGMEKVKVVMQIL